MKRLAILILLALTGLAEARGSSCHEVSKVVGYSACRRFGAWSNPVTMFTEAGVAMLHIDVDGINRVMASAGAQPSTVSATAGTWRVAVSIAWFYLGDEMSFGSITGGPQLTTAPLPAMTLAERQQPESSSGFLVQNAMIFGARTRTGPLSIGGEVAIGIRIGEYTSPSLPAPLYSTTEADFMLQARAKADYWVSTWLTVGAIASMSMLDRHDVGVFATVGVHALPYDGLR